MALAIDPSSPSGLTRSGKVAGWKEKRSNGFYWRVSVNGKTRYCHQIVWELRNGPVPEGMSVDHIDRNTENNRIENLRLASSTLQIRNRRTWGACGYKWVSKDGSKWRSEWYLSKDKKIYVGNYDTPWLAHLASLSSRLEVLWPL